MDSAPFYLSLGKTAKVRTEKYKNWLHETVPEGEWKLIRESSQRGQLTGRRAFSEKIALKLGRRVELRGPGRPKKLKK